MSIISVATAILMLGVESVTWSAANSVATGDQDVPSIAANRNGHVAVVWEDDRDTTAPADDAHSEIFLRLYRNGTSVYELKLSGGGTSGVAWKHVTPDVGLDDRGNAVVVWADDPDGNGYYNVPYRVVSPTGTVLASGRANANTDGQQVFPKVSVDPDGVPGSTSAVAFTVVWEDIQGTNPATVRAAGYTAAATKAYEVVASQTTGDHRRPDVAALPSGEALVAWGNAGDIGLVRLARANGAVTLSRRLANAQTAGQQQRPAVAANYAGDFAVAWESAGVWVRSFAAAGSPRHTDLEVASSGVAPGIGIDDQGNVALAWSVGGTDPQVWITGRNPDGTGTGRLGAQVLSQATAGRQEQIAVAASPWSEVSVAYTDDNDGNQFDQIIFGTGVTNSTW
ncbi:hypothetical protein [Phytohabitans houttuyneae]|uniref:Fibronectin type-III domain-containing protein n=1 Tax=Phytohabitans houttuyneae TaxID=1076126 RepID=A0A6V8K0F3_9ACTN|nr:hypothetical protein [Phytohabitans houttuyneae]GFJ77124.1 hypothetical protein Phou_013040 [Phytohabitans houttuyneae]